MTTPLLCSGQSCSWSSVAQSMLTSRWEGPATCLCNGWGQCSVRVWLLAPFSLQPSEAVSLSGLLEQSPKKRQAVLKYIHGRILSVVDR